MVRLGKIHLLPYDEYSKRRLSTVLRHKGPRRGVPIQNEDDAFTCNKRSPSLGERKRMQLHLAQPPAHGGWDI